MNFWPKTAKFCKELIKMDEIDKRILALLRRNARATVKEIASNVSLTSPAVSERIRRLEKSGVIEGYTVRINPEYSRRAIHAFVSISVPAGDRAALAQLLEKQPDVLRYFQVTGSHSHMVEVRCSDITALEKLINRLQKLGQTNTQIILTTKPGAAPEV